MPNVVLEDSQRQGPNVRLNPGEEGCCHRETEGDTDVLAYEEGTEPVRYSVNDLPVVGTGAFTPTLTIPAAASSWGLVERDGAPGTERQHVTAPTRTWAPPISFDPKTQGSNVAPDVTLRDVYTPYADNMGPASPQGAGIGMTTRRFNPLPVPAISWTAIPRRAMRPRRTGGRAQVDQPRAFQRFPNFAARPFRNQVN